MRSGCSDNEIFKNNDDIRERLLAGDAETIRKQKLYKDLCDAYAHIKNEMER